MPRKRNSSRLLRSGKVAARIAEAPADGFPVVAGLKLPPALEYGRPACVSNGHRAPWAAMALFLECNGSDEETNAPTRADDRNFYKLEKWTKDGTKVDRQTTISIRRATCSRRPSNIDLRSADDPAENNECWTSIRKWARRPGASLRPPDRHSPQAPEVSGVQPCHVRR